MSTPVGPLGSGLGGGVELTVTCLVQILQTLGHQVQVVAPSGSELADTDLVTVPGNLQVPAQSQTRQTPIQLPSQPVLGEQWRYAYAVQSDWDIIVNFAYDWLPYYLTPFFDCPIAHFISMGSLGNALDAIATETLRQYPGSIGVYTRSQAATFPFAADCTILGSAIDLAQYHYNPTPEAALAWVGRISPEKALEDAVAAVVQVNLPLRIFGKLQDHQYWQQIQQDYPQAQLDYRGFLDTDQLQAELGKCRALIMTPRWVEAFGNVAIEALACGVPVIAYNRGGPGEIILDGHTGFLVEPNNVSGLVSSIHELPGLKRAFCRQSAEQNYSLIGWGQRFVEWLVTVKQV
ncbi:MAG: glycosyltransferase [Cyanobacteria bacterium P01_H01_bin.15]